MTRLSAARQHPVPRHVDVALEGGPLDGQWRSVRVGPAGELPARLTFIQAVRAGSGRRRVDFRFDTYFRVDDRYNEALGEPRRIYAARGEADDDA